MRISWYVIGAATILTLNLAPVSVAEEGQCAVGGYGCACIGGLAQNCTDTGSGKGCAAGVGLHDGYYFGVVCADG